MRSRAGRGLGALECTWDTQRGLGENQQSGGAPVGRAAAAHCADEPRGQARIRRRWNAGEVNLGLGDVVEVVGEDVQADIGDEFSDLGVGPAGGAEGS